MIKSSFQTYYKLFWLKDVFRIVSTCVRINIFIGLADEIVIVILWINIEWRLKIKLKGRCTHKKFYPQSGASLFFTVIPKKKIFNSNNNNSFIHTFSHLWSEVPAADLWWMASTALTDDVELWKTGRKLQACKILWCIQFLGTSNRQIDNQYS